MFSVWIPITPTQYESAEWVLLRNDAKKRMIGWCEDQKIEQHQDFNYIFIKCLYKGIHCHVFNFEQSTHAMLFKLTFGGVAPVVRSQSPSQQ